MHLTQSRPAPSKVCLFHHFIRYDIRQVTHRMRRYLSRRDMQYLARHHYAMPDSQLCKQALQLARQCSPVFLLNHCLRSHAFASALATEMRLTFDPEMLFVGCILHDLGLTETYDDGATFELSGARAAHAFCRQQGVSKHKSALVHEMVALHNAIGTADNHEPEVVLLHFGAGADVIGLHLRDIHPRTLREILATFPRDNFGEAMAELISQQVASKPDSYMSTMVKMGFLHKMKSLSFDKACSD